MMIPFSVMLCHRTAGYVIVTACPTPYGYQLSGWTMDGRYLNALIPLHEYYAVHDTAQLVIERIKGMIYDDRAQSDVFDSEANWTLRNW